MTYDDDMKKVKDWLGFTDEGVKVVLAEEKEPSKLASSLMDLYQEEDKELKEAGWTQEEINNYQSEYIARYYRYNASSIATEDQRKKEKQNDRG